MRRDFENHSNMYMRVDARLEAHSALWNTITGFTANVTGFRDRLSVIQAKRLIALADTIGQTQSKKNIRAQLAETADKVADTLRVVATKTNDPELFQLAKISINLITKKLPDTDAEIRCTQIHNAATSRVAALEAEGLDPAEVALLGSRVTVYHNVLNLPRQKTEDIKAANQSLAVLIPELNLYLKNILDGNVRALPDNPTNFAFKQAYALAREVVDNAGGGGEEDEPTPPTPPGP